MTDNASLPKPLRLLWRCLGFGIGSLYLAAGTLVLYVLLLGGLWEGFGRSSYTVTFLAMVLYVYGTAALGFYFGLRPGRLSGAILCLLLIPALVFLLSSESTQNHKRELVQAFVHADEPQVRDQARRELLSLGPRAGRQPHIDALLNELERAETDQQRQRIVCLLGRVSHQHPPVIEALEALYGKVSTDPQRSALAQQLELSLLLSKPQPIDRWQEIARLRNDPTACSG